MPMTKMENIFLKNNSTFNIQNFGENNERFDQSHYPAIREDPFR